MGYTMKHNTKDTPILKKGPCWETHEMVGMKMKGNRKVPNCIPKKDDIN